eukprot:Colp12_sorted_trinity150504_noHs@5366
MDDRKYGRQEYWSERYTKYFSKEDEDITEEWYFGYEDLKPIIEDHLKKIKKGGTVVDVGCGVSSFFSDMLDDGFNKLKLVGIDYVESVVEHMKKAQPGAEFLKLDACNEMHGHFGGDSVDLIFDKATTDGLLCGPSSSSKSEDEQEPPAKKQKVSKGKSTKRAKAETDGQESVIKMYENIAKVLKPGGAILMITVNNPLDDWFQKCVLNPLVTESAEKYKWNVEINVSEDVDLEDPDPDADGEERKVIFIRKSARPAKKDTDELVEIEISTWE